MEAQLTSVLSGNYTPPEPTGRSSRVTASNKTRAVTFAAVKVSREQVLEATHKVSRKAAATSSHRRAILHRSRTSWSVEDAVGKRQKRCSKPLWLTYKTLAPVSVTCGLHRPTSISFCET